MGNRKAILWILSFVPLSLAAMGGGGIEPATAQAVRIAGAVPAGIEASSPRSSVVGVSWTLRDEDLFACETAAYDLRALLREHRGQVSVRAIAVDADPSLVASFMRNERLDITVAYVSAEQYRLAYGAPPRPGVVVTHRGRLVEALNTGQLRVQGRRDTRSLGEIVTGLVSGTRSSLARQ